MNSINSKIQPFYGITKGNFGNLIWVQLMQKYSDSLELLKAILGRSYDFN